MPIYAAGHTDTGPKRAHNEDDFELLHGHRVYAVADGSGGSGQRVARTALDAFASVFREAGAPPSKSASGGSGLFAASIEAEAQQRNRLVGAVRLANRAVHRLVRSVDSLKGCGVTLLACDVSEPDRRAVFAWVGEPIAFHVQSAASAMRAVTTPHTLVNEQLKAGMITPHEARRSSFKNVVTRVLGFDEHVVVDTAAVPFAVDDMFVLCTDGVWQSLSDDELCRLVLTTKGRGLPATAVAIVQGTNQAATNAGDNATAIVIRCAS